MENTNHSPLVAGIDTVASLVEIEAWALDEPALAEAEAALTVLEAH